MNKDTAMRLIRSYIEGWRERDRAKILDTLDPDCMIVECYGPVYRGAARVGAWIDAWFGEGNSVDRWDITSLLAGDDGAAVEWRFACTWHGTFSTFDGASIVRFKGERIAYLREYQTTETLYDWAGEWRS